MRRGARIRASPSLTSSRRAPRDSGRERAWLFALLTREQRIGGGTAVPFSDEDRTLASVCSRIVSVAEVDRRRLAQRNVASIPS
jgi:hypothetical protein